MSQSAYLLHRKEDYFFMHMIEFCLNKKRSDLRKAHVLDSVEDEASSLHITIESLPLLIVIAECWVSLYQIS